MRGRSRERVSIGRDPQVTLADARTQAKKLLGPDPEPKNPRIAYTDARDEFLRKNYRDSDSVGRGSHPRPDEAAQARRANLNVMTPSEMGKKGAAATNAKLTPEQRSANARKRAAKRWGKRKKEPRLAA